jgi:hypothetical protein
VVLGMSLAGCATPNIAQSVKGECQVFVAPTYAIQGKTKPDQQWVDINTESGIAGCGWKRPKPRPKVVASKATVPVPVARPTPTVVEVPDAPVQVLPPTKWERIKSFFKYWAVH